MLDSLFYNDQVIDNQTISVVGYTDYVGGTDYNNTLSHARAQYVTEYFVSMGMKPAQVKQTIGKGEVARNIEKQGGYQTDRRVDVILELKGSTTPRKPQTVVNTTPNPIQQKMNIATGQTFVLDKIYFFAGRHVVKPESMPELDKLYNALATNPGVQVQIEGHVCCVRSAPDALDEDTNELALSTNRAKYIYNYLLEKGIDNKRLKYKGFGRLRPVVIRELSAADEDRNRRVEIRVLSR